MMKKHFRATLVSTLVIGVIASALLGYREIFLDGVEDLPDKVCQGAVERTTAAKLLPATGKVTQHSERGRPGRERIFSCSLMTEEESILLAEATVREASPESWREFYANRTEGDSISLPGEIKSISWPKSASVYIPCTPLSVEEPSEPQPHALIISAEMFNKSRASGRELRQAIIDFTFQIARHSYTVADCKEKAVFPSDPPQLPTHR